MGKKPFLFICLSFVMFARKYTQYSKDRKDEDVI